MTELGPCFRAPRHDPETCPHDESWRFAWTADEPVTRTRRGVPQIAVQTVEFIVCMACDTLLVDGGVLRRPRDWQRVPERRESDT